MHSHDRSLLAKLGFADSDKQNPRHDLACQYLARRADALLDRFWQKRIGDDPRAERPRFEAPLSKGEGQYKTTIGFIDVLMVVTEEYTSKHWDCICSKWEEGDRERRPAGAISIEVKISKVSVGDMLRQIGLYQEYRGSDIWVIATAFPLARPELQSLESNQIRHVLLGSGFEEWIERESRRQEQDPPSMIEI